MRTDVAELAAVELELDGVPQRLFLNVAQDVQCFHQPPELAQCAGKAIRCVGIDQALHDDMGRGQPVLQRCRQAHQFIPLLEDEFDIATRHWRFANIRRIRTDSPSVVKNAAKHVAGFARRARDDLRAVDAVLVGGVRIELQRAVVVAEIARIDAAEQTFRFDREALAVGGGAASVAPDAAEFQAVMVIAMWTVFQTSTALERRLKQLALFITSS